MGLGDIISKYVIEIPKAKAEAAATTTTTTTSTTTPSTTISVQDSSGPGQVDKKFIEHFEGVLRAANKPGPDAFEYMNMLNSLEGLGLTEEQMYKAAWKQFKNTDGTSNRTVDSVIVDLADYVKAINADQDSNFNGQVAEAKKPTGKIGKLYAQRDQINKDVLQWTAEIQALQDKIRVSNETLSGVNDQLTTEENKLNTNIKNYAATKEAILVNLQKMGEKMKQHIV